MRFKTKLRALYSMRTSRTIIAISAWLSLFLLFSNISAIAQCPLSCRALVNLSLNDKGTFEVTIYTVMNNPQAPCLLNYEIKIFDKDQKPVDNPVTCAYLGQTLTYTVTDTTTGNWCWGNLYVEDKLNPALFCVDVTIQCNDDDSPESIGLVFANDNCDDDPEILSQGEIRTVTDCDNPNGILYTITRTWIAQDTSGNFSAPCTQHIYVRKPNLSQVVFPANLTKANGTDLDCADPDISPDSLGFPTLFGKPLELACQIKSTFTDSIVPQCEGSVNILRTWFVIDCCNNNFIKHVQIIEKNDKTPPVAICAPGFTLLTEVGKCYRTVTLPKPLITDNCSDSIKVTIFGSGLGQKGYGPYELAPGLYEITYQVCDGCNNCSYCQLEFEILDKETPTVICNTQLTLPLDTSGNVILTVADLENGTTDNCCLDTLQIKLMGQPDSLLSQQIAFNCSDVNQSFLVILKAEECHGNTNFCMSSVTIVDTIPPEIICPQDLTVHCNETIDPDSLGVAIAFDNCAIDTIFFQDSTVLTPCNTGNIFRKWTAVDTFSNSSFCIQTISIIDTTDALITFPGDVTISCDLNPDTTLTGSPAAVDDCSIFEISFSDSFVNPPVGCNFIVRTWMVKDICKNTTVPSIQRITLNDVKPPVWLNSAGSLDMTISCDKVFSAPVPTAIDDCTIDNVVIHTLTSNIECKNKYQRTITYRAFDGCGNASVPFFVYVTVRDDLKPIFSFCPKDTIIDAAPNQCGRNINFAPAVATDNCGDLVIVNDSPNTNPNGADISGFYPVGTTIVTIMAIDDCNNRDTCVVNITVRDVTPPFAECAGASVNLIGYINPSDSLYIITPQVIKNNWDYYDLCSSVTVDISPDTFDCNVAGPPPKPFAVTITDAAGNSTVCNGNVLVLDSLKICGDMFADGNILSGKLSTVGHKPIGGVGVNVEMAGGNQNILSDQDGNFILKKIPEGMSLNIQPQKTDEYLNGVDVLDAILLTRHLLGKKYFTDPYSYLAADVNDSHTLNVADLGEIKRLIVHSQQAFSSNKSWKFLDAKCKNELLEQPLSGKLPESIYLDKLSGSSYFNDFISIKLGDVNMSSKAYGIKSNDTETRTTAPAVLVLPDILLKKDIPTKVAIVLNNAHEINGLQFGMKINDRANTSIIPTPETSIGEEGLHYDKTNNTIYAVYVRDQGIEPKSLSMALLNITIQVDEDIPLRKLISLLPENETTKAMDTHDAECGVELVFSGKSDVPAEQIKIYKNKPNPFKNETIWPVFNPGNAIVAKLTVSGIDGKQLLERELGLESGYQEISISRNDLPASGCYFVKIIGENVNYTGKIVVMD